VARIYTRTGDQGSTGLFGGERVAKDSARIEALGAVDETNAAIGLARALLNIEPDLERMLDRIQHLLFDLGADLASPGQSRRVGAARTARLEADIDRLEAQLEPLKAFILPGGAPAAAALHLARTVCRRAERAVVAVGEEPEALIFLNRLSDLLFVAARWANRDRGDVLWKSEG
jgi:cob(I)alamin adenosyltransferase